MKTMVLKTDKRLVKAIPLLTEEQRERLVESLMTEGCREPLIVYKGEILEQ